MQSTKFLSYETTLVTLIIDKSSLVYQHIEPSPSMYSQFLISKSFDKAVKKSLASPLGFAVLVALIEYQEYSKSWTIIGTSPKRSFMKLLF